MLTATHFFTSIQSSPSSRARCAIPAALRNKFLLVNSGAVNSPLRLSKGEKMKVREFFESAKSGGQLVICSAFIAALLNSCEKNSEIKVYRVSKAPLEESAPQQQDAIPTNTAAPRMPSGLAPTTETTVVTPPNWRPQALSQMRQASFLVKGDNGAVADISFVSLGASAGNVLENVNRWLSQIGQPAIDEQKLNQIAQRLTTSLGDVTVVDLEGLPADADPKKDGRIIAAMTTNGSSTLFFKIRGNAAQAANAMMPQSSDKPQIKWQLPAGWSEVPPSAMRYASFSTGANENKI